MKSRRWHVLYLLLVEDTAKALFVKIGVTTKIDHRLGAIQTGCPHEIRSVRHVLIPTGRMAYTCERDLLVAMAPFRSGGGTEWFRLDGEEARSGLNAALKAIIPRFAGPRHTWTILKPSEIRQIARDYAEEVALARRETKKARTLYSALVES